MIVNRVWAWHFGKPLVATESDFGVQGEKPTHPELLDDLAARFIANGWSLKWLHREIMLSATYRQASHPRADGIAADPTNKLLWRMNPRRLDVEAYRDNLLEVSGDSGREAGAAFGRSGCAENHRRTVYGRVSRGRLNTVLALYDFPDPMMTRSAARTDDFAAAAVVRHEQPVHAGARGRSGEAAWIPTPDIAAKVRDMYRRALQPRPESERTGSCAELSRQRHARRNTRRHCWQRTR